MCMQIGGGKLVFRYAADAVVVHHGSQDSSTGRTIEENREIFHTCWRAVISSDNFYYFKRNHYNLYILIIMFRRSIKI